LKPAIFIYTAAGTAIWLGVKMWGAARIDGSIFIQFGTHWHLNAVLLVSRTAPQTSRAEVERFEWGYWEVMTEVDQEGVVGFGDSCSTI
jgi:hypothetical protein